MEIKKIPMLLVFTICWTFVLFNYSAAKAEWYFETVGSGGCIRSNSIVLDSDGNRHISYINDRLFYGRMQYLLTYAYYDCNWHREAERAITAAGTNSALALDSSNHPHISYYSSYCSYSMWPPDGTCYLEYFYCDGTLWHSEWIEAWGYECACFNNPVVGLPSLCLDSNDNPHISYTVGEDLYYSYYDGNWHFEIVDSPTEVYSYTTIALDSSNNPHISYRDANGDLKYAHFDGIWHHEVVNIDCGEGFLIIDSYDHPHISYYDFTNNDLRYAHYDGTSWHIETVDSAGDVGRFSSLALDSNNIPHISYYDFTNNDLKYAHYDGTSWHIETVDSAGDVGRFSSLALDSNNIPHISYCDGYGSNNRNLKYTRLACPNDFDCDGCNTDEDNCPDIANPCQEDTDGDDVGDICDDCTDTDMDGYGNPGYANLNCPDDNCPDDYNPDQENSDGDRYGNACDNCSYIFNNLQEDSYPPGGNGIGDACECEGNFNCFLDQDVDGSDAATFKVDFGRSVIVHPCNAGDLCSGDFNCDGDVDGTDASLFKSDFGRSSMQNPCPACIAGEWCAY